MMELLDVTSIAEALITLLIAVVGVVYTYLRNKSNNADQLDRWVQIAVSAAEQAYKTGVTDDRKAYAQDVLAKQGIKLDWDKVDDMIEAAVNQLPAAQRAVTSESMMDGRGD